MKSHLTRLVVCLQALKIQSFKANYNLICFHHLCQPFTCKHEYLRSRSFSIKCVIFLFRKEEPKRRKKIKKKKKERNFWLAISFQSCYQCSLITWLIGYLKTDQIKRTKDKEKLIYDSWSCVHNFFFYFILNPAIWLIYNQLGLEVNLSYPILHIINAWCSYMWPNLWQGYQQQAAVHFQPLSICMLKSPPCEGNLACLREENKTFTSLSLINVWFW